MPQLGRTRANMPRGTISELTAGHWPLNQGALAGQGVCRERDCTAADSDAASAPSTNIIRLLTVLTVATALMAPDAMAQSPVAAGAQANDAAQPPLRLSKDEHLTLAIHTAGDERAACGAHRT